MESFPIGGVRVNSPENHENRENRGRSRKVREIERNTSNDPFAWRSSEEMSPTEPRTVNADACKITRYMK